MISINKLSLKFKFVIYSVVVIVILMIISKVLPPPTPSISTSFPTPTPSVDISPTGDISIPDYLQKEAIDQSVKDYTYGQIIQQSLKKRPYLKMFPIITNRYTLVYDWEKSAVRVRLANTGITPADVETEIREKLSDINAPVDIPLDYLY
jgi:hypothetical protein